MCTTSPHAVSSQRISVYFFKDDLSPMETYRDRSIRRDSIACSFTRAGAKGGGLQSRRDTTQFARLQNAAAFLGNTSRRVASSPIQAHPTEPRGAVRIHVDAVSERGVAIREHKEAEPSSEPPLITGKRQGALIHCFELVAKPTLVE
jgi:hypothetical protein